MVAGMSGWWLVFMGRSWRLLRECFEFGCGPWLGSEVRGET